MEGFLVDLKEGQVVGPVKVVISNPDTLSICFGVGEMAHINRLRYEGHIDMKKGASGWKVEALAITQAGVRLGPTKATLNILYQWAPKFASDWVAANPDLVAKSLRDGLERERAKLIQQKRDLLSQLDRVNLQLEALNP